MLIVDIYAAKLKCLSIKARGWQTLQLDTLHSLVLRANCITERFLYAVTVRVTVGISISDQTYAL